MCQRMAGRLTEMKKTAGRSGWASGYPGGGGRRRGGYPGGGGGRYPGGGQTSTNQVKEYKVYVTSDTVLKLEDQDMVFSDMHVGDRIIVSGIVRRGWARRIRRIVARHVG